LSVMEGLLTPSSQERSPFAYVVCPSVLVKIYVPFVCRTEGRGGLWLARVGDETEARKAPALRAITRARLPRLAVAAFRGYNR
jgi:hypothetical protein